MAMTKEELAALRGEVDTEPGVDIAGLRQQVALEEVQATQMPTMDLREPDPDPREKIIANAFSSTITSPFAVDKKAAVLGISKELGADPQFVENNFEAVQQSWLQSGFDPKKWMEENYLLADMMAKHPDTREVVMGDERISSATKNLRGAVVSGKLLEEAYDQSGLKLGIEDTGFWKTLQTVFDPINFAWSLIGSFSNVDPHSEGATTDLLYAANRGPPRQIPYVEDERAREGREAGTFKKAWMNFQDAQTGIEMSHTGMALLASTLKGEDTYELEKRLIALQNTVVPRDYGEKSTLDSILQATAEQGPVQLEIAKGAGVAGAAGALLGAGAGAALPILGGAAKGAARGAVLFGKAGAATAGFALETGSAYLEYRDMTTPTGEKIDKNLAIGAALVYGTAASFIETMSFGAAEQALGPLGDAIKKGAGKEHIKKLMGEQSFRQIATNAAHAWMEHSATEGVEEFMQNVLQDVVGNAALSVQAGERLPMDTLGTIEGAATAALGGAISAGAMGVHRPTIALGMKLMNHDASVRSSKVVTAIKDVAGTISAEVSPRAAAELVEQATGDSGEKVTHLYAEPGVILNVIENSGTAAEALLGEEGAAELQQAAAMGGKWVVPVEAFFQMVNGNELVKDLADHFATRPGYLSKKEQVLQQSKIFKDAQKLVDQEKKAAAEAEAADADPKKKRKVRQPTEVERNLILSVKEQLLATGNYTEEEASANVALMSALVRTMAKRWREENEAITEDALFGHYLMLVENSKEVPNADNLAIAQDALTIDSVYAQSAAHGSWAKSISEFLWEHMGSGEGAQAFGYGFYFTQRKDLAEHYRKTAAGNAYFRAVAPVVGGQPVNQFGGTRAESLLNQARIIASSNDYESEEATRDAVIKELKKSRDFHKYSLGVVAQYDDAIALAEKATFPVVKKEDFTGQVYDVDVPEDHDLGHWDALMVEQPRPVLEKLVAAKLIPKGMLDVYDSRQEWSQVRKTTVEEAEAAGLAYADYMETATTPAAMRMRELAEEAVRGSNSPRNLGNLPSRTFRDFYYSFGRGSTPEAVTSMKLQEAGIPGHKFLDGQSRSNGGNTYNFVIWDTDRIRIERTYYQDSVTSGARGFMQRIDNLFLIALTGHADKTTFLHELSHVFLEVFVDLANRPDAPESFKEDADVVRKWFGVPEGQTVEVTKDRHEKWAETWERLLEEGVAPSKKLVRPFMLYAKWLGEVYKGWKDRHPNADLTPEIRKVFQRLIATDYEIAKAMNSEALQPMFNSPAAMEKALGRKVTEKEWRDYLDAQEDAKAASTIAVQVVMHKEELREKDAWWKAAEQENTIKFRQEYENQPARRAWMFLNGRVLEGVKNLQAGSPILLDHNAVVEMLGEEWARLSGTKKQEGEADHIRFRTSKSEDAMHPDEVAAAFELTDGKEMLKDILALPDREDWVQGKVAEAMAQKYPDLLADRNRLRQLIDEELSKNHEKMFLTEYAALRSRGGFVKDPTTGKKKAKKDKADVPIEAIKAAGQMYAEGFKVGQLNPDIVLRNERSNRNKALKAAAKGHYQQAMVFYQKALLNMYAHAHMRKLVREKDKFIRDAKKYSRLKREQRKRIGKASRALLDNLELVLEALEFKKPAERTVAPASVEALRTALAEAEIDPGFDFELITKILKGPGTTRSGTKYTTSTGKTRTRYNRPLTFNDLTVDEMRQVQAFFKNVMAAARQINTVLVDGRRINKEQVKQSLREELSKNRVLRGPAQHRTTGVKVGEWLSGVDGSLKKLATMILTMTGGDQNAMWYRAVELVLQQAAQREADMIEDVLKPIKEKMEAIPKTEVARLEEKIDGKKLFPDWKANTIDRPDTVRHLVHLMFNIGNDSNAQRVRDGLGATKEQVIAAFNEHGSKELMDWVQSVWDEHEKIRDLVTQTEIEDSGVAPTMIDPVPLDTRWGVYAGGYFKLAYRWDAPHEALNGSQRIPVPLLGHLTLDKITDKTYVRPGTPRAHLKERVKNYNGVIQMDSFGVIYGALLQEVHDITHRQAVKSVSNLLLDSEVVNMLIEYMGAPKTRQFVQSLRDISQMRGMDLPAHTSELNQFVRKSRRNTGRALLGYMMRLMLGDIPNSLLPILPHWKRYGMLAVDRGTFAKTWAEYLRQPFHALGGTSEMLEFARKNSGQVRLMQQDMINEFHRDIQKLEGRNILTVGPLSWMIDHAHSFVEALARFSTVPMWTAAYRSALDKGVSHEEAVIAGDRVLQMNYSSMQPINTSAIMRDKGFWGLSVLFYTWINGVLYQQTALTADPIAQAMVRRWDPTAQERKGRDWKAVAKRIPKGTGEMMALMMVAHVMAEFLMGRGPAVDDGDSDAERWATWLLWQLAVGPVNTLPLGGELTGVLEKTIAGRTASIRASPMTVYGDLIGRGIVDAFNGKKGVAERVLGGVEAVSVVYGIPIAPTRMAKAAAGGDISPEAMLYGKKKNPTMNIFRWSLKDEAAKRRRRRTGGLYVPAKRSKR